jgi:LAO/AO transport system kinase
LTAEDTEIDELVSGVLAGSRRALAKSITLVESSRADHQKRAQRLLERVLPRSGRAVRLGLSGVPGAGKSTFIEALGAYLIGKGRRVAVLAIDPSSSVSGGSVLGDKTRMPELAAAPEAFIRPSPTSGALGGVARHTREAMVLCEAAGYDVVIVETVGVGQSEHAVANMVDTFLLLGLAGAGDELQGIKRGILELIDVIAINKADGDNRAKAERAAVEYRSALRLLRGEDAPWTPRVLTVSALERSGIDRVWALLEEHRRWLTESGGLDERRRAQRQAWLASLVHEGLEAQFRACEAVQRALPDVERRVHDGLITPTEGARRLLELFLRER